MPAKGRGRTAPDRGRSGASWIWSTPLDAGASEGEFRSGYALTPSPSHSKNNLSFLQKGGPRKESSQRTATALFFYPSCRDFQLSLREFHLSLINSDPLSGWVHSLASYAESLVCAPYSQLPPFPRKHAVLSDRPGAVQAADPRLTAPPPGQLSTPYSTSIRGSRLRSLAKRTRRPALLLNEPAAPWTPANQKSEPCTGLPSRLSPSSSVNGLSSTLL